MYVSRNTVARLCNVRVSSTYAYNLTERFYGDLLSRKQ